MYVVDVVVQQYDKGRFVVQELGEGGGLGCSYEIDNEEEALEHALWVESLIHRAKAKGKPGWPRHREWC